MAKTETAGRGDGNGADFETLVQHLTRSTRKTKTAVFIAAIAALLAIVSMAESNVSKRAMVAHIEASNQFAYFQAKNIRKTDSEIAAQMFAGLGQAQLASEWGAKADRYQSEKAEILAGARAQQAIRVEALRQADYYDIAIAFLQLAIVLASASLVTRGGFLFAASAVLVIAGAGFAVNGAGLYWELPSDPGVAGAWIADQARAAWQREPG